MSVLIQGMRMPKNCIECKIKAYDANENEEYCPFTDIVCLNIGRQDNCPLTEIPEKHGRIINLDKFIDGLINPQNKKTCVELARECTILEAEGADK